MATILCITPSGYLLLLGWWARSSAFLIQPVLDNLKMFQIRGTLFPLMLVCKSILSFYQLRSEILMRLRAGSTSSTTNTCPTRMPSETRSPSATGSTCEFHDFSFQRKRQTISAGKEENPDALMNKTHSRWFHIYWLKRGKVSASFPELWLWRVPSAPSQTTRRYLGAFWCMCCPPPADFHCCSLCEKNRREYLRTLHNLALICYLSATDYPVKRCWRWGDLPPTRKQVKQTLVCSDLLDTSRNH